jgi:hypothetical protein
MIHTFPPKTKLLLLIRKNTSVPNLVNAGKKSSISKLGGPGRRLNTTGISPFRYVSGIKKIYWLYYYLLFGIAKYAFKIPIRILNNEVFP